MVRKSYFLAAAFGLALFLVSPAWAETDGAEEDGAEAVEYVSTAVTATPQIAGVGELVTFTFTITNIGPIAEDGFYLDARITGNMRYKRRTCDGPIDTEQNNFKFAHMDALQPQESFSCQVIGVLQDCSPLVGKLIATSTHDKKTTGNNLATAVLNEPLPAVVLDPGFEAGHPSTVWTESSTNFPSLIVQDGSFYANYQFISQCPSWSAWLGGCDTGAAQAESATLSQTVTIPATTAPYARLGFHVRNPDSSATGADFIRLLVDGEEKWKLVETPPPLPPALPTHVQNTYKYFDIDAKPYADGSTHTVAFNGEFGCTTDNPTNFYLDNVWYVTCQDHDTLLFSEHFETPGPDDADWTEIAGIWKVPEIRMYVSRYTKNNIALANQFMANPLTVGRIQANVKLTKRCLRYPNAAIVWAYVSDGASRKYRYARIKAGKLIVGEVGDFDGDPLTKPLKQSFAYPFAVGKTYRLTLDLNYDGTVNIYEGTTLVGSVVFPKADANQDPAGGAFGFWAKKAKAIFDDVEVHEEAVLP